MEASYEEVLESYEGVFGLLRLSEKKIPISVLQQLFSEGRSDVIGWIFSNFNAMKDDTVLGDFILCIPLDITSTTILQIVRFIPDGNTLIKILSNLCGKIVSGNPQPAIAVRTLLRSTAFWKFKGFIGGFKRLFNEQPAFVCRTILVGHADPTRATFIEELIPDSIIDVIEILLTTDGIDVVYATATFDRHRKKILASPSLARLFNSVVLFTDSDGYRWFLEKMKSHLILSDFSIVYESCLVDHIMITELEVELDIDHWITCMPSEDADKEDIAAYCGWLIVTGRIRNIDARVFVTLVQRLFRMNNTVLVIDMFRACHFMSHVQQAEILELILESCRAECSFASKDSLPQKVETILDLLGQTRHLTTFVGKTAILSVRSQSIINYAWGTAMEIASEKEDVAIDMILSGIRTKRFTEESGIKTLIDLALRQVDDPKKLQRFGMLFIEYFAELKINFERIIASRLDPSRDIPTVSYRITSLIIQHCPISVLTDEAFHRIDPSSLSYRAAVQACNSSLHRLCEEISNTSPEARLDKVVKCRLLINHLGTRAQVVNPSVLRCMKLGMYVSTLLQAVLEVTDNMEFIDKCITNYITGNSKLDFGILVTHCHKFGPRSFEAFLDNPFIFHSILFSCREFCEVARPYIQKNPASYLRLILANYSVSSLDELRTFIANHTFIFEDIRIVDYELHFGGKKFSRSGSRLALDRDQSIKKFCSTLVLSYEDNTVHGVCRVCTEPLDSPIFIDNRDVFGVYYCKQCASSIIHADGEKHISQVTCCICMQDDTTMVVLPCRHSFCTECVKTMHSGYRPQCPTCRQPLSQNPIKTINCEHAIADFIARIH